MGCQESVDPGGISLEPASDRRGQKRELGLGGAIEAEDAHLPVGRRRLRPEDLGEPSRTITALQLHLEEAVLGMDEAEAEGGILVIAGGDQRHAVGIAVDADLGFQPGEDEAAAGLRQGRQQIKSDPAAEDHEQRQQARKNAPDHGASLSRCTRRDPRKFPCRQRKTGRNFIKAASFSKIFIYVICLWSKSDASGTPWQGNFDKSLTTEAYRHLALSRRSRAPFSQAIWLAI